MRGASLSLGGYNLKTKILLAKKYTPGKAPIVNKKYLRLLEIFITTKADEAPISWTGSDLKKIGTRLHLGHSPKC
jgi:hypothetical protein